MIKLNNILRESIEQHRRKVYLKTAIEIASSLVRRGYSQRDAIKDAASSVKEVNGYELTPQDIEAIKYFVPEHPNFKEAEDFDLSDNPLRVNYPKKITATLKKRDWVDSDAFLEIDGKDFNKWLGEVHNTNWEEVKDGGFNWYSLSTLIEYYVDDFQKRNGRNIADWHEFQRSNRWFRVSKVKIKS